MCNLIFYDIVDTKICVSTPDRKSPADGDSGGPLLYKTDKNSKFVQIGILSSGYANNYAKGYPVLYTRVTSYLKWIKDKSGVVYY